MEVLTFAAIAVAVLSLLVALTSVDGFANAIYLKVDYLLKTK
jgi:hypothetical protein